MADAAIRLTIAFEDPQLEPEAREEQAQHLLAELRQLDEVETVDLVLDPNPPAGNKAAGAFLPGWLLAEVTVANGKKLLGFLGDRLGGKPISLEVEGNGKKLKVSAHSREELAAAIQAAKDFIES